MNNYIQFFAMLLLYSFTAICSSCNCTGIKKEINYTTKRDKPTHSTLPAARLQGTPENLSKSNPSPENTAVPATPAPSSAGEASTPSQDPALPITPVLKIDDVEVEIGKEVKVSLQVIQGDVTGYTIDEISVTQQSKAKKIAVNPFFDDLAYLEDRPLKKEDGSYISLKCKPQNTSNINIVAGIYTLTVVIKKGEDKVTSQSQITVTAAVIAENKGREEKGKKIQKKQKGNSANQYTIFNIKNQEKIAFTTAEEKPIICLTYQKPIKRLQDEGLKIKDLVVIKKENGNPITQPKPTWFNKKNKKIREEVMLSQFKNTGTYEVHIKIGKKGDDAEDVTKHCIISVTDATPQKSQSTLPTAPPPAYTSTENLCTILEK